MNFYYNCTRTHLSMHAQAVIKLLCQTPLSDLMMLRRPSVGLGRSSVERKQQRFLLAICQSGYSTDRKQRTVKQLRRTA